MARLTRDLPGAEPVDRFGAATGKPVLLSAGTEYVVTIPKIRRPGEEMETLWCELKVGDQLYRVPRRNLEFSSAA